MSSSRDTFSDILKKHGYSLTRPRLVVFDALLDQEPLSMQELVQKTSSIDRASVYRTVSLLEELGVILRINIGWKYKLELSEAFSSHHHHISCIKCGKTIALNERALEQVIERLGALHGFEATAHQIEIQGHCKNCKTNSAAIV